MAKKVAVRTLDFTDVKEGITYSPKRQPEGDYRGKVTAVVDVESKAKNDMLVFTITTPDDNTRATYPYYCVLNKDSMWKLYALLEGAGMKALSEMDEAVQQVVKLVKGAA